jgi:hypothetical protein
VCLAGESKNPVDFMEAEEVRMKSEARLKEEEENERCVSFVVYLFLRQARFIC